MNCPKCGKKLVMVRGGLGHIYSQAQLLKLMRSGEPVCRYLIPYTMP